MCLNRWWIVITTQPQVFIEPVGIHHLAWIHLPVRIPYGLELAECFDKLVSIHHW